MEIYDSDGDPIDQASQKISLKGNSGETFKYVSDTDCNGAQSFKFTATNN